MGPDLANIYRKHLQDTVAGGGSGAPVPERFGGLVLAVLCEPNSMSLDKSLHLSLVSQSLHSKNGNESLVPHTHKLTSA